MVVFRKENARSVFICRLIKKINNGNKKVQWEKLIQTLIFSKLPISYEVSIRRNVM